MGKEKEKKMKHVPCGMEGCNRLAKFYVCLMLRYAADGEPLFKFLPYAVCKVEVRDIDLLITHFISDEQWQQLGANMIAEGYVPPVMEYSELILVPTDVENTNLEFKDLGPYIQEQARNIYNERTKQETPNETIS